MHPGRSSEFVTTLLRMAKPQFAWLVGDNLLVPLPILHKIPLLFESLSGVIFCLFARLLDLTLARLQGILKRVPQ